jgi:hypothetical protein
MTQLILLTFIFPQQKLTIIFFLIVVEILLYYENKRFSFKLTIGCMRSKRDKKEFLLKNYMDLHSMNIKIFKKSIQQYSSQLKNKYFLKN